jgi:hypothetical protein
MWLDAFGAGAAAGLLAEALVLRMNPEVAQTMRGVVVGMPLWASWGMLMVGVPLLAVLAVLNRVWPRRDRWTAPELFSIVFFLAASLSAVNASLHAYLMPGSAHRVLVQDAVAWSVAIVLTMGAGMTVRRLGRGRRTQIVFSVVVLLLPMLRLVWAPTPERQFLEVAARPLGPAARPLLVIGLEGLDSKVLLADTVGSNLPNFARLREEGARAVVNPHRPYLRLALWTSAATGTYPGRHGIKGSRAWNIPLVFDETLRLLPWTPEGSRMILPWALAEQVVPPPATVAPLWARLEASGVSTAVFGWPGSWGRDGSVRSEPDLVAETVLEPTMNASLAAALEPLPDRRAEIWRAILHDQARVDAAREALEGGADNVWIHLEALSLVRRHHEPTRSRHTRQRRLVELVMELVDDQLASLLDASEASALVAVVSPYGLAPPGGFERFRRLLGGGETWKTSAKSSPDGLFVLLGAEVEVGSRLASANVPDVAPTLCYLLDLPVAQYMEGVVAVGLVDPEYLEGHPLRVVD